MSSFVIIALIINGFYIFSGYGQLNLTPYSLTYQELEQPNTYRLRCTNSIGIAVQDAVFFRNGALNTTDECFTEANATDDGVLELGLASECDGRFMCGITGSEMGEYILSGPTKIRATPMVTSSEVITLQAEEGQDVTVSCPFSQSPLAEYQITLWKNNGGDLELASTVSHSTAPNDLTIVNVTIDDTGLYFCQLFDISNTLYTSPNIKLQIFAKFELPMIVNDLSYSINYDKGTTQYTVIATGTDLQYQWKINGTIYDNDEGELTVQKVPSIGETSIYVKVWNTRYDGISYEEQQTLVIDKAVDTVVEASTCSVFSSSTDSGRANIALLLILLLVVLLLVVILVIVVFVMVCRRTRTQSSSELATTDNSRVVRVKIKDDVVEINTDKLEEEFPRVFDKLDMILDYILTNSSYETRNPKVDPKIRELKSTIASLINSGLNDTETPTTGNDQVPRGPNGDKDYFNLLLPSIGNWMGNFYEQVN